VKLGNFLSARASGSTRLRGLSSGGTRGERPAAPEEVAGARTALGSMVIQPGSRVAT